MIEIYTDTHPEVRSVGGDECNTNDCSRYSHVQKTNVFDLSQDELHYIAQVSIQCASSLFIQQVTDGQWTVCNPIGAGHVFVMNAEALALLKRFHLPLTLAEACKTGEPPLALVRALGMLLKGNILVDSQKLFRHVRQNTTQTLTAWLHITNQCNLRCSYCYIKKNHESMSETTAYQSVDAIFRSAVKHDLQHIELKYAGGEASLQPDHILAIHDYAQQLAERHGISLSACLLSNGVYLSQGMLLALKERAIRLMISLDGTETYHDSQRHFKNGLGSFKYVDRTIQKLLQHNILPSISVTVSQRNIAGLPELMEYLLERVLPFSLNYYRENACSAHIEDLAFQEQHLIQGMHSVFHVIEQRLPRHSLFRSLLDKADLTQAHEHTCGIGQNYLVINQHGSIAKCQVAIQQQITTIHANDPLQSIREDRRGPIALSVDEKEGCRECLWRYWCTGGCPMLTYQMTGRSDVRSPNCHIYQALFPEVLRLEALRLLAYESAYSCG